MSITPEAVSGYDARFQTASKSVLAMATASNSASMLISSIGGTRLVAEHRGPRAAARVGAIKSSIAVLIDLPSLPAIVGRPRRTTRWARRDGRDTRQLSGSAPA